MLRRQAVALARVGDLRVPLALSACWRRDDGDPVLKALLEAIGSYRPVTRA